MFLKDGKTIFGNTGLIISLIILVVLLFFSYNKCMVIDGFETIIFSNTSNNSQQTVPQITMQGTMTGTMPGTMLDTKTNTSSQKSTPEPQNVRVNINGNTVTLNFTVDTSNNASLPKKFMVVLVQYDNNLKNTGNNKFFISNEYEINTNVAVTQSVYQTNLCGLVNGLPSCGYSFSNLDVLDSAGNPYYYKVGISAVYDWGNSNFVTPYNVSSSNKLFTINSTIDAQNNLYSDFLKYKQLQAQQSASSYANSMATADGQYEFIKSQLGGYPSNLLMEEPSASQNLLSDLVDKSMSQALLNVNVSVPR